MWPMSSIQTHTHRLTYGCQQLQCACARLPFRVTLLNLSLNGCYGVFFRAASQFCFTNTMPETGSGINPYARRLHPRPPAAKAECILHTEMGDIGAVACVSVSTAHAYVSAKVPHKLWSAHVSMYVYVLLCERARESVPCSGCWCAREAPFTSHCGCDPYKISFTNISFFKIYFELVWFGWWWMYTTTTTTRRVCCKCVPHKCRRVLHIRLFACIYVQACTVNSV